MTGQIKIHECSYFAHPGSLENGETHSRTVRNYELDFNLAGGRIIRIDDRSYEVSEGSVIFRKPGQFCSSCGEYNMIMLTLGIGEPAWKSRDNAQHLTPKIPALEWLELPAIFIPEHRAEILSIYRRLTILVRQPSRAEATQAQLSRLLHLLQSDAELDRLQRLDSETPIDRMLSYIETHFHEPITLDLLAEGVHLNKHYMIRKFKQETGRTPIDMIISIRLTHAKQLLSFTGLSVGDIAGKCGFESSSYFCDRFKKTFGMSPGDYRDSKQNRRL